MPKRTYEVMVLFDSSDANKDWDGLVEHAHGLVEKHNGTILKSRKWDERKLAYEIKDMRRGTYLLIYAEIDVQTEIVDDKHVDTISRLRRDFKLSDKVVRSLILVDEDIPEIIKEEEAAEKAEAKKEAEEKVASGESS